jgi:hypothetical protein
MSDGKVPRIVHFIFGLRPQEEPFGLLHYLSIASARSALKPERVIVHVGELPYGIYWDLIRSQVEVRRIQPLDDVTKRRRAADVDAYRYAHHSDVIRLDVLLRDGGIYLDIDTLTLRPFPAAWYEHDFTIGAEGPVAGLGPSLLNAVMMSRPRASFARIWRDEIIEAMDGTWSAHSCVLAAKLAQRHPQTVHVVPVACFSSIGPDVEPLRELLVDEQPEGEPVSKDVLYGSSDEGPYVLHLCAHLWWDEKRTDFLAFSGIDLDEAYVTAGRTRFAHLAKPFLPDNPWRC